MAFSGGARAGTRRSWLRVCGATKSAAVVATDPPNPQSRLETYGPSCLYPSFSR